MDLLQYHAPNQEVRHFKDVIGNWRRREPVHSISSKVTTLASCVISCCLVVAMLHLQRVRYVLSVDCWIRGGGMLNQF